MYFYIFTHKTIAVAVSKAIGLGLCNSLHLGASQALDIFNSNYSEDSILSEVAANELLRCEDNRVEQQTVEMHEVGYAAFPVVNKWC